MPKNKLQKERWNYHLLYGAISKLFSSHLCLNIVILNLDLTYIAGKYDFPIPVAQILLYVFLPLVQVTRIHFLYKFPYITIIAALCLIVTCFVFLSHFITACLKPINIQVSTSKWNYKFQFRENKPLFRLISFK